MNKKVLLIIGGLLILIGLVKPDLSKLFNLNKTVDNASVVKLEEPSDANIKKECEDVIKILSSGDSKDAIRLRDLYLDISKLIELDGEDLVIKNTEEIRQANALAGNMLRLDIKNKYENLATEAKEVIVSVIGDDNISLSPEIRQQAVMSFRYLAWACNEGSK